MWSTTYIQTAVLRVGCPLSGINCIWHMVPGPIPASPQCPGAPSHMAWPKSFQPESGECKGCLPEKSGGGTNSVLMNDLPTDIMCVGREEGNDSNSPLPSWTAERVSGPSVTGAVRGQILKTEWSLNQTIADINFRAWGRPFVYLFVLGKTRNWQYTSPPFRRRWRGKWIVLSRTGTTCTHGRTLR